MKLEWVMHGRFCRTGQRLVEFIVNIEQRVNRAITLGMRGELQAAFESGFHDGQEPLLGMNNTPRYFGSVIEYIWLTPHGSRM